MHEPEIKYGGLKFLLAMICLFGLVYIWGKIRPILDDLIPMRIQLLFVMGGAALVVGYWCRIFYLANKKDKKELYESGYNDAMRKRDIEDFEKAISNENKNEKTAH